MKNYKLARRTLTVLLMTLMITSVFAIMPAMGCQNTGCSCNWGKITLGPESAVNNIGEKHTVTATVLCCRCECPIEEFDVTFIISGVHAGTFGPVTTDSNGKATFSYTGTTAGTDCITATIVNTGCCGSNCCSDCSSGTMTSNQVTKEWVDPDAEIPEFPTIAIPVLSIIGLMFIMSRRRD